MPDIAQYPGGLVDPVVNTLKRNNELQRLEAEKRRLTEEGNVAHQRSMDVAGILQKQSGDPSAQFKTLGGESPDVATQATKAFETFKPEVPEDIREALFNDAEKIKTSQDLELFLSQYKEDVPNFLSEEEITGMRDTFKQRDAEAGTLSAEKLSSQQSLTRSRDRSNLGGDDKLTESEQLTLNKKREDAVRIKVNDRSMSLKQADSRIDELDEKIVAQQTRLDKFPEELDDAGVREKAGVLAEKLTLEEQRDRIIKKMNEARDKLQTDNQTTTADDELDEIFK